MWGAVLAAITQNGAFAGSSAMVSVNAQQIVGNNDSYDPSLSKGGSAVAFESDAANLTLGDGNNARDVFIKGGKTLTRISVNSLGQEGFNSGLHNGNTINWWDSNNYADSENPSISADGKLVVFQSNANNLDLLTQDSNNDTDNDKETDIFLRDVAKKKTYRLSGIMDGADNAITPDLKDAKNQPLAKADAPWKILTEANDASANPVIAGTLKAGVVAFESKATNLSSPFTPSGKKNIYVIDLKTKKIELISAAHDPLTGAPTTQAQNATPAAVDSTNPALSPDGRFVAFQSSATNLVSGVSGTAKTDIFLYDRVTFRMYQLSGALSASAPFSVTAEGNENSGNASITGGGKGKSYLIAFDSAATNLDSVQGGDSGPDSDIFVVEFKPGASIVPSDPLSVGEILSVKRISGPVDANGNVIGEAWRENGDRDADSNFPVIAGNNTAYTVAFKSEADNLLADTLDSFWNEDSNKVADIYVYDSKTRLFSRANVDVGGEQGIKVADRPALSPDGKAVGFDTVDDYLVPFFGDNEDTQVYLRKR
ncbi:hypothetical protein [Methylomicrobium lacus]|uniref:hypothetical protein n=1 Tax=Methylomicrobium lacus TaxID=136992 RepID=UPI0035A97B63